MEPSKKSVLIAEDESSLRDLYRSLLTQDGYAVEAVVNGEEAYAKVKDGKYDLLLLDILMPKMSGLELLERLQQEGKLGNIKNIVMLTNLSDDTKIAEALRYGIRGYMVKSNYTPDTFISEVRNYLA